MGKKVYALFICIAAVLMTPLVAQTPQPGRSNGNISSLFNEFSSNFPQRFRIESKATKGDAPLLLNGDNVLNDNPLVQTFTKRTGAVATIFVKTNGDFMRISTSLQKEDGSFATGTCLDQSSSAYKNLIDGKNYSGKTRLFGKDYLAEYGPIRDAEGKVIGALFVGVPA